MLIAHFGRNAADTGYMSAGTIRNSWKIFFPFLGGRKKGGTVKNCKNDYLECIEEVERSINGIFDGICTDDDCPFCDECRKYVLCLVSITEIGFIIVKQGHC